MSDLKLCPYYKTNKNNQRVQFLANKNNFYGELFEALFSNKAENVLKGWILRQQNKDIGFLLYEDGKECDTDGINTRFVYVNYLLIDADNRNKGYGTFLLQHFLTFAQQKYEVVTVEVAVDNYSSQSYFEKQGFAKQLIQIDPLFLKFTKIFDQKLLKEFQDDGIMPI